MLWAPLWDLRRGARRARRGDRLARGRDGLRPDLGLQGPPRRPRRRERPPVAASRLAKRPREAGARALARAGTQDSASAV